MSEQCTAFNCILQVTPSRVYNVFCVPKKGALTLALYRIISEDVIHMNISVRKVFMSFLAVAFPWLAMLIKDNPGGAFVALILQATVVGWIPASIWAWRTVHASNKEKPPETRRSTTLDNARK